MTSANSGCPKRNIEPKPRMIQLFNIKTLKFNVLLHYDNNSCKYHKPGVLKNHEEQAEAAI